MASSKQIRKRRNVVAAIIAILLLVIGVQPDFLSEQQSFDAVDDQQQTEVLAENINTGDLARETLEALAVHGRASKSGYSRDQFSTGWATIGSCDTRNIMLQRSLTDIEFGSDECVVLSGVLQDPYTGREIAFLRGGSTSGDVQIDHVVALSDAWQKGAQQLDETRRLLFANDPLNLLAVDGPANQQKGDSDAASWLPPNKSYRCRYVARQIAVKQEYSLWVTAAEKAVMKRVLNGCGEQRLPVEEFTTS
jgi:hypothetical protein